MNFYNEKIASNYENKRRHDRFWSWENNILSNFVRLNCNSSFSIIDCPCGTGRFIDEFKGKCLTYTGIDISSDMLNKAKTKSQDNNNINLIQSNILKVELKCDIYLCFRLLHLVDFKTSCKVFDKIFITTNHYAILQIFNLYDYSLNFKSFNFIKTNTSFFDKIKYFFRSLKSLLNFKKHSLYGNIENTVHDTDYTNETYWLNFKLLKKYLRDTNFKIEHHHKLKDNYHYLNENMFFSTSIIILKKNG